jgi:hypothetical protein
MEINEVLLYFSDEDELEIKGSRSFQHVALRIYLSSSST